MCEGDELNFTLGRRGLDGFRLSDFTLSVGDLLPGTFASDLGGTSLRI